MANDLIPYKRPGDDITCVTTAAVTGKRCVQITAAKVNHGEGLGTTSDGGCYKVGLPSASGADGAGYQVLGVAKYDAVQGAFVGVVTDGIVPIHTSGAINAGDLVQVAADGTVVAHSTGVAIGMALDDAGNDTDAEIMLFEGIGVAGASFTPQAAVPALTDNSGGAAADGTIAVVTPPTISDWDGSTPPSAAQATAIIAADTAARDAIKELATKVNAIITALKNAGITG